MTSWSASAYPPPRRSRSRSPSRGAYPSRAHFDPAYVQDPYRADWDAYDRDRWASYERDRAAYEYSRRGRSRSPPPLDDSRKRRRSLSPYERDRYDPRPRYGDEYDAHSRAYSYGSPRRGQYNSPSFSNIRRAPPDPHTFEYPASLKQYAEWFRYFYPQQAIDEDNADKAAEAEAGDGSKPRNGIKTRWEKYKKEFSATQLQTMFDHHRKSPWFAEKYSPAPEFQYLRQRVRKVGWKGRINAFLLDLDAGKFDPDPTEPELERVSHPKENSMNVENLTSDANGAGVEEQKVMGGGDEEMQFTLEPEEENIDPDPGRPEANGKSSFDSKRANRGDEISVMPEGNQVMIRTIPPDIGRIKLEEACKKIPGFLYMALGDPLQKRNYYRAGWLRFRDDADMPAVLAELSEKKIEGFKLHVTYNLRPFVNRVRYTPEVASRPDRIAKDLANVKILAGILENEAASLRRAKDSTAGEGAQNETNFTDPNRGNDSDIGCDDDPEPKENGSDAVERRIEKVMAELRDQNLVDIHNEQAYELKKTEISLDFYLAYLRAAFHTCYYCAIVSDHLEELQRKCLKHARKPLPKALLETTEAERTEKGTKSNDDEREKEQDREPVVIKERSNDNRDWKRNDDRWLDWLDAKCALLINRDGVDPRDYGGKSFDEELTKAVEPYIKQEDEGKFRCKTCQKLFKATSFVEKHIANKHTEFVKHLDEIPYFNNFALDPHRIQPFTHPPTSTGNSQQPPPQAYGIQGPTPYHNASDHGRPPSHYSNYPPSLPPHSNGSYWEHYGHPYGMYSYPPPPPPPRRDEATTARRLSDRISGYASGPDQVAEPPFVPVAAGLPPKPVASLESAPSSRRGGRGSMGGGSGGPPPPPPPDAKEDPRAAAGKKVSYYDMDLVAEGDVELTY